MCSVFTGSVPWRQLSSVTPWASSFSLTSRTNNRSSMSATGSLSCPPTLTVRTQTSYCVGTKSIWKTPELYRRTGHEKWLKNTGMLLSLQVFRSLHTKFIGVYWVYWSHRVGWLLVCPHIIFKWLLLIRYRYVGFFVNAFVVLGLNFCVWCLITSYDDNFFKICFWYKCYTK